MSAYPEHDKLTAISDKSQAIGEFLDWLESERGIYLCIEDPENPGRESLCRVFIPYNRLLAEFFEIDPVKIEEEKRAMLAALRAGS